MTEIEEVKESPSPRLRSPRCQKVLDRESNESTQESEKQNYGRSYQHKPESRRHGK